MRTLFVHVVLFFGLVCIGPQANADNSLSEIHVLRGTVLRQVPGCEVDGWCSVVLQTEHGEEEVVWNKGERMPDMACPQDIIAEDIASKLTPGQSAEMHVRMSRGKYMLCGPGASINTAVIPTHPENSSRN